MHEKNKPIHFPSLESYENLSKRDGFEWRRVTYVSGMRVHTMEAISVCLHRPCNTLVAQSNISSSNQSVLLRPYQYICLKWLMRLNSIIMQENQMTQRKQLVIPLHCARFIR